MLRVRGYETSKPHCRPPRPPPAPFLAAHTMAMVWSRTSYSGDKWLKVGRRRRCHHGDNRTESENRACQLIDTGLLTFSIRKEARKYKLLCRFYNTLFSGSGSRLWQLLLNCMVSQVRTTEYNTKHNNTKGSCQKKNVFFLGYLSQICFPTHPPQGFCEIWENER